MNPWVRVGWKSSHDDPSGRLEVAWKLNATRRAPSVRECAAALDAAGVHYRIRERWRGDHRGHVTHFQVMHPANVERLLATDLFNDYTRERIEKALSFAPSRKRLPAWSV